jgi:glycosyltransferase involved in cell wall biosynthesis
MDPKVTVILSVFNGSSHFRESVESILSQTLDDIELILIDDGSTDDTPGVIAGLKDQRINAVRHEKSVGLTRSLNEGLQLARGKYIARQDSDDISLPDRLKRQYSFLEEHPELILTGCGAEIIYDNGRKASSFVPVTDPDKLVKGFSQKCQIFHPSIMFRNSRGISYRDKFVYSQDYDLYLRLLTQGEKIANMPDILIKYRLSPGAISYAKRAHQFLFSEKAREFYQQRLTTGRDSYDDFRTESILSIDAGSTDDWRLLQNEIKAGIEIEDLPRIRSFYLKYLRVRKKPDRYFLYFLMSFFPVGLLRMAKKIRPKKKIGKLDE